MVSCGVKRVEYVERHGVHKSAGNAMYRRGRCNDNLGNSWKLLFNKPLAEVTSGFEQCSKAVMILLPDGLIHHLSRKKIGGLVQTSSPSASEQGVSRSSCEFYGTLANCENSSKSVAVMEYPTGFQMRSSFGNWIERGQ